MKKKFLIIFLAALMLVSGCGRNTNSTTELKETDLTVYTFTDDLGREVIVENPQRVAALLGSFADMWVLAGGEVYASADDAWEDFQIDMPEGAVNLGKTKEISLEKGKRFKTVAFNLGMILYSIFFIILMVALLFV